MGLHPKPVVYWIVGTIVVSSLLHTGTTTRTGLFTRHLKRTDLPNTFFSCFVQREYEPYYHPVVGKYIIWYSYFEFYC